MALSSIFLPSFLSKPIVLHQSRAFQKILATNLTPQSLKSRLSQGKQVHGVLLFSTSPTIAKIAALAGYDIIVVYLEHGQGDVIDALHCIRAVKAADSSSVICILEITLALAKKALDVAPMVLCFRKLKASKTRPMRSLFAAVRLKEFEDVLILS